MQHRRRKGTELGDSPDQNGKYRLDPKKVRDRTRHGMAETDLHGNHKKTDRNAWSLTTQEKPNGTDPIKAKPTQARAGRKFNSLQKPFGALHFLNISSFNELTKRRLANDG
jgi:hypothetical protein